MEYPMLASGYACTLLLLTTGAVGKARSEGVITAPRCVPAFGTPLSTQPNVQQLAQSALDVPAVARGGAFATGRPPRIAIGSQKLAWLNFVGALTGSKSSRGSNEVAPGHAHSVDARVISIGGSMPAGMRCVDPLHYKTQGECAYPHRVMRALTTFSASARAGVGQGPARISYLNLCQGGAQTASVLPMLPAMLAELRRDASTSTSAATSVSANASRGTTPESVGPPTLLLIDFSANDANEYWDPRRADELVATTEALLRYLLRAEPSFALLLAETFPSLTPRLPRVFARAYQRVTTHYAVPHVRYSNVVTDGTMRRAWYENGCALPNATVEALTDVRGASALGSAPPAALSAVLGSIKISGDGRGGLLLRDKCDVHPFAPVHELVSYVVASSVLALGRALSCAEGAGELQPPQRLAPIKTRSSPERLLDLSQVSPLSPAELLSRVAVCEHPTSQHLAAAHFKAQQQHGGAVASGGGSSGGSVQAVTSTGGWRLYEDRPGKPGWISEGPLNSTLTFPLRFGAVPTVTFAFLQGYDASLGTVQLRMIDVREPPYDVPLRLTATEQGVSRGGEGTPLRVVADGVAARQRALRRQAQANIAQVSARSPAAIATQASVLLLEAWKLEGLMGVGPKVKHKGARLAAGFGIAPFSNATLAVTLACDPPGTCTCRGEARSGPGAEGGSAAAGRAEDVVGCKFKVLSVTSC